MTDCDRFSENSRTHAAMDGLLRVMRLHRRVVEKRIDGLGIHPSQHRMLMRLSCMGRTASQKDIAAALEVSQPCVARTLKALSAAGLISKDEGQDGRRNEISILPEGQRLIDRSLETFRQIDREMYEGISDDALDALARTLERIHDNLCRMEQAEAAVEGSDDT